jgi:hypothetical protein
MHDTLLSTIGAGPEPGSYSLGHIVCLDHSSTVSLVVGRLFTVSLVMGRLFACSLSSRRRSRGRTSNTYPLASAAETRYVLPSGKTLSVSQEQPPGVVRELLGNKYDVCTPSKLMLGLGVKAARSRGDSNQAMN